LVGKGIVIRSSNECSLGEELVMPENTNFKFIVADEGTGAKLKDVKILSRISTSDPTFYNVTFFTRETFTNRLGVAEGAAPLFVDIFFEVSRQGYLTHITTKQKFNLGSSKTFDIKLSTVAEGHTKTGDPFKGSLNPIITIVKYEDFKSRNSKSGQVIITRILEDYSDYVQIVHKSFPVPVAPAGEGRDYTYGSSTPTISQSSMLAAQGAECADQKGKFWPMHDLLYENQDSLSVPVIKALALRLGMDVTEFGKCLSASATGSTIYDDYQFGLKQKVTGTPVYFIYGPKVSIVFNTYTQAQILVQDPIKLDGVPEQTELEAIIDTMLYDELFYRSPRRGPDFEAQKNYEGIDSIVDLYDPRNKTVPRVPVTIMEFCDYTNPDCRAVQPTIDRLFSTYGNDIRLIHKELPKSKSGMPYKAAMASQCFYSSLRPGDLEQYTEFERLMYKKQDSFLSTGILKDLAKQLYGTANTYVFDNCLAFDGREPSIDTDMKHANTLGVTTVPTYFINGKKITGVRSFDEFKRIINRKIFIVETPYVDSIVEQLAPQAKRDTYSSVRNTLIREGWSETIAIRVADELYK